MIGTEDSEQRRLEVVGHRSLGATRERSGKSATAAPQQPAGKCPANPGDAVETSVRFRVEDADAILKRVQGIADPRVERPCAELRDDAIADRVPPAIRSARKLLAAPRRPSLMRKGRRDDAGVPCAGSKAGIELRDPRAPKKAVD